MKKLVLLSIVIAAMVSQNASAQYQTNVLFTTYADFLQWSGENGSTGVATTDFDADGSTVNGIGNTNAAGGTGTAGALQIGFSGPGYNGVANSPSEANNYAMMTALDPGSVGGTAVNYSSGLLQITYSLPTPVSGGTYFQIGVNMQYNGDGYYNPIFSTSVVDLGYSDQYGQEVYQATIPYTINAGPGFFFGLGFNVDFNSDYNPAAFPVYVDEITSLTPTPEPGTMALCGLGALGFTFFARRRRA